MYEAPVEIYADTPNAAILRHPGHRFPGVLLQGDTLHALCMNFDRALSAMDRTHPAFEELNDLRNHLRELRLHYMQTLGKHDMALPFSDP